MLELKGISKAYTIRKQKRYVLKNINLQFQQNEIVAIYGQSGSGKSTLLNIVGGLDKPGEGVMLLGNKTTDGYSEVELANYRNKHIGFIFQSFNLIPNLTALENVKIVLTIGNAQSKTQRAMELLALVGLGNLINNKPTELSGGEKQRVCVARALAMNPSIILADEPTGSLDSINTKEVMELLVNIARKENKLVLIVTHDENIADYCNRIIKIEDGQVIEDEVKYTIKNEVSGKIDFRKKKSKIKIIDSVKIVMKNMFSKKMRTSMLTLGGAVAIIGMLLMLGIANGMERQSVNQIKNLVNAEELIVHKKSNNSLITITDENINEISNLNKVSGIYQNLEFDYEFIRYPNMNFSLAEENNKFNVIGTTLPPTNINYKFQNRKLIFGRMPENNETGVIVISKSLGEQLIGPLHSVEDYIGKKVVMKLYYNEMGQDKYTFEKHEYGGEIEVEVVGVSKNGMIWENIAYIPYETGKLYATESKGAEIFNKEITVILNDISNIKETHNQIENLGYEIETYEDLIEMIEKESQGTKIFFILISSVSLIITGILIGVILNISVLERFREIGILKALGARKSSIKNIFMLESSFIGFISGILGIVIALLMMLLINSALPDGEEKFIIITISDMIMAIILSTVICLIAGFIPSRKAANLNPIDALRHE